jgi:hypothetical protein
MCTTIYSTEEAIVPDLRIELSQEVLAIIETRTGKNAQEIISMLMSSVNHSAYASVGEELGLKPSDFWARANICYSDVTVVYVDVTMLMKPNRTPEVRKKLADWIKLGLSQFLRFGGPDTQGIEVLVWIHMKDPDADYAETAE